MYDIHTFGFSVRALHGLGALERRVGDDVRRAARGDAERERRAEAGLVHAGERLPGVGGLHVGRRQPPVGGLTSLK